MTLLRRLVRFAFAAALAALAGTAPAQDYPRQPVHIIVPWAAGGFTDVLGRLLAEKMAKTLGQPVIVENRPGASGSIGAEYVSRSAPDGHTLLLATSDALVFNLNTAHAHATAPATNQKPGYDASADFVQISLIGTQPVFLMVGSHVPAKTVAEFVKLAKEKPGKISYASSGEGSAVHLAMEVFSEQAGIRMIHVPYKGINPGLLDVVGGQVDSLFISLQGGGAQMKAGKVRPLAITSLERSPLAPDVPTLHEAGYPNFELTLWYMLAAPKGTPQPIVDKLHQAVKAAIAQPDVREKLQTGNTKPLGTSPDEARAFLASEVKKWNSAIKAASKPKS